MRLPRAGDLMVRDDDPLLAVRLQMIDHDGLDAPERDEFHADTAQQGLRDHLSLRVPTAPY